MQGFEFSSHYVSLCVKECSFKIKRLEKEVDLPCNVFSQPLTMLFFESHLEENMVVINVNGRAHFIHL